MRCGLSARICDKLKIGCGSSHYQSFEPQYWSSKPWDLASRQSWDSWHWPCCRYWAEPLPIPPRIGPGIRCKAPWQPPHHYQSSVRRLLRPTLVFWLSVVAGKVTFLITIETCDLTNITPLFLFFQNIGGVNISGRSLFFLLASMFPPLILELLLFIFLGVFFRGLRRIITWWSWLWILGFDFFGAGQVLRALGLRL